MNIYTAQKSSSPPTPEQIQLLRDVQMGFFFFLLFFFSNFWQKYEEIDSESRTIFQSCLPSLHCYACQQKHAGSLSEGTGILQTPHQPWLLRAARVVCCSRTGRSWAWQGWSPLLLVLIDLFSSRPRRFREHDLQFYEHQTASYGHIFLFQKKRCRAVLQ